MDNPSFCNKYKKEIIITWPMKLEKDMSARCAVLNLL